MSSKSFAETIQSPDHTTASGLCCSSPVLQLSLLLNFLPKKTFSHCLLLQCLLLAKLHPTITTFLPSHPSLPFLPMWEAHVHVFNHLECWFSFKEASFGQDRVTGPKDQALSASSQVGIALLHHVEVVEVSGTPNAPAVKGDTVLP